MNLSHQIMNLLEESEEVRISDPIYDDMPFPGQWKIFITAYQGENPTQDAVGYIELSLYEKELRIEMIRVKDTMRRKGIGSKLVRAAQEFADSEGFELIWTYASEEGAALKDALGYKDET